MPPSSSLGCTAALGENSHCSERENSSQTFFGTEPHGKTFFFLPTQTLGGGGSPSHIYVYYSVLLHFGNSHPGLPCHFQNSLRLHTTVFLWDSWPHCISGCWAGLVAGQWVSFILPLAFAFHSIQTRQAAGLSFLAAWCHALSSFSPCLEAPSNPISMSRHKLLPPSPSALNIVFSGSAGFARESKHATGACFHSALSPCARQHFLKIRLRGLLDPISASSILASIVGDTAGSRNSLSQNTAFTLQGGSTHGFGNNHCTCLLWVPFCFKHAYHEKENQIRTS